MFSAPSEKWENRTRSCTFLQHAATSSAATDPELQIRQEMWYFRAQFDREAISVRSLRHMQTTWLKRRVKSCSNLFFTEVPIIVAFFPVQGRLTRKSILSISDMITTFFHTRNWSKFHDVKILLPSIVKQRSRAGLFFNQLFHFG